MSFLDEPDERHEEEEEESDAFDGRLFDDQLFDDEGIFDVSDDRPLLGAEAVPDENLLGRMSNKPEIIPQYVAVIFATMGALAMGTVVGYSSPAGPILRADNSSLHLSETEDSWFSSSSNLGALVGSPMAGFAINYFGRRGTMIYSLIPFIAGWVLIVAAQNFAMLILGRLLTGFCCGLVCVSVPTYISEYASPHIRGTLGTCFQLMVVTGILLVYALGAVFDSFRWIAAVCGIVPCIFSIGMIFSKESPIYLLSKNRDTEAKAALDYFRGAAFSGIDKEFLAMRESVEESKTRSVQFSDLKKSYVLRPFIVSLGLMLFQQFCGINGVLFNLNTIFKDAGTSMSPTVSSIIIGIMQLIGTLLGAVLMDRAGRKLLLAISALCMAVALAALGVFFYLKDHHSEYISSISFLPLLCLVVFILAFSIGYGPIPWLMMSELFIPEVKELTSSLAALFNWTCAFITTLIFQPLQNVLHSYGIYWMFACFCGLNLVFVILCVYETKGKTLHEITAHYGAPTASSSGKNEERNVRI